MNFLEKDLERILEEQLNEDPEVLYDLGLEHIDFSSKPKVFRQLRIGNYGIADLVTVQRWYEELFVDVYELKKGVIDIDALLQVSTYSKGIMSYLKKRGFKNILMRKILIGSRVNTSGKLPYLFDECDSWNFKRTEVYSFDYTINGISFNYYDLKGFDLIDKGF